MGDFGGDSEDSDGEDGMGNVNRLIMRPPGHSGKAKRGHLCFDASFESGNLGRIDLINEYEYDLFIRPDTCSPRVRFWFNFTVDNVKQDQRVIFNIVNISNTKNLFMGKMTPLVRSSSRQEWQPIPKTSVFYYKSLTHQGQLVLSFSFAFDREDEIFQFALAPPFTYSRLQMFLSILETKGAYLKESFQRQLLCSTVQKRRLDMVTIGSLDRSNPYSKRRVVAIMARMHPGESPASFVCQGLLELLISSNAIADKLRSHVIFKVIPMMNPDGVFLGNHKSTYMGVDLNRSWNIATQWSHPTLKAATDMIVHLDKHKELELDFVIDIHAHSNLEGCFVYGNTYEDVYRYERHVLFPKLLARSTEGYQHENAMFNADPRKLGTARRHLRQILSDRVNCYTFEVSFYGHKLRASSEMIPYNEESYMRCGRNLIRTFLAYYQSIGTIPIDIIPELKQRKRSRRRLLRFVREKTCKNQHRDRLEARLNNLLHFKDLKINGDTYTSMEENAEDSKRYCSQFRARETKSTRNMYMAKHNNVDNVAGNNFQEFQAAQNVVIFPEPSLSIIDFNSMTRQDSNEWIYLTENGKPKNMHIS